MPNVLSVTQQSASKHWKTEHKLQCRQNHPFSLTPREGMQCPLRRLCPTPAHRIGKHNSVTVTPHHNHHHNQFTAIFPGPPRWAGARRELLDFKVQGEINRGRHKDHPAGRHSIRTNQCPPPPSPHIFYGPDALPAAQPTVSKHLIPVPLSLTCLFMLLPHDHLLTLSTHHSHHP